MRRSKRARLKWIALQAFAGGLLWLAYVKAMQAVGFFQRADPPGLQIFLAGALIFGAMAAFEFYVYRASAGVWLRRLPILPALLLHNLALLAIAAAILAAIRLPVYLKETASLGDLAGRPGILRDALLAVVATFVLTTWSQIRAMIGPRTLVNLVLGNYRRPRREMRIFAFVDVKNSTAIAAKIGDERFHAYLSRFFFDIDEAVVDLGGEVNSYVGDAAIITWPIREPQRNADAVNAIFAIRDLAARSAERFRLEFGTPVEIRAALHGGHVVAGECGDSKRQITYLGDVVNVTARLEQAAKQMGRDIVISSALLRETALPEQIKAEALGAVELKGQPKPVEIFALSRGEKS